MTNEEHIKKLNKILERNKIRKKINEFIIDIILMFITSYCIIEIIAGIISKL